MDRRHSPAIAPYAALALSVLLIAGCSDSPSGPEVRFFDEVEAHAQGAGSTEYLFELADPQIVWAVDYLDEFDAGGGPIGGAETESSAVEPVGGVWTFELTADMAWDWTGYSETEPDGIILSAYPHRFESSNERANGDVTVDVRDITPRGKKGKLRGVVTGGIIEEVLLPGGWAQRIRATFDITKGTGVMKRYSGHGVVESIYDYTTRSWLQNSVSLTLIN
jgi:hypothetical protein